MVLTVAVVLRSVRSVEVAGGAQLGADHVIAQVIHCDRRALLHNDHLYAGGVSVGEVHDSLPLVVDRDTAHGHIALAVLDGRQSGIKGHIVDDQLQAQLLGDLGGQLVVDALKAAVVGQNAVGREVRVGGQDQLARLQSLQSGPGLLVILVPTGGEQSQAHHSAQGQSSDLLEVFHFHQSPFFLSVRMCIIIHSRRIKCNPFFLCILHKNTN